MTPVTSTIIRVMFTEAFVQNADFFNPSNYVFRVRSGPVVEIFADNIGVCNSVTADIFLKDAMLDGGDYELSIFNIVGLNNLPIQDG